MSRSALLNPLSGTHKKAAGSGVQLELGMMDSDLVMQNALFYTEENDDLECDQKFDIPEWADSTYDAMLDSKQAEGEFLMMRMSSFYISVAQNILEKFIAANLGSFFSEMDGSSMHSVLQYEIYRAYIDLFESTMEQFLSDSSIEELVDALKFSYTQTAAGKDSMGTIMLSLLEAVTNFEGLYFVQYACS